MSSPVLTTAGGVFVVTQGYPINHPHAVQPGCVGTQKFGKAHPLALGAVQIVIGLMTLLFGVVMAINAQSLSVFSGIFVWGAGFYVTAGSLTVAAGKSFNRCLVNTTLAFNIVASVVSSTAIILYTMDATGVLMYCYNYDSESRYYCYVYWQLMKGFSGVLAVFHLLEFIVSITVAAFACKATCNCNSPQPCLFVVPANASEAAQAVPTSHATPVSVAQPPPQVGIYPKDTDGQFLPGLTEPPAYTVTG
uniref:membrane-spanning 4-domains subfamily A member 4A-like n=1 Tax=Semicossyphus pulcher TaxID=241346 RepID=UPI0037E931EA